MTAGLPSLLKYETPVQIAQKDDVKNAQETAQQEGISKERDALNAMLPPKRYQDRNGLWIQYVSSTPATRHDVVQLKRQLDQHLQHRKARETGICPIREELYKQCFDEVIRQVAVNCSERGMLLLNIRNEMHMTIKAYQTLFESAIAFGLRRSLASEESQSEKETRIEELETENANLTQQFTEWKAKCTAIEKREVERREQESTKHKEEIDYLENYARQLRQQLDALTTTI